MQNTVFLVNDEPFCLWGFDLKQRNDEFLRGLDAEYFDYCLKAHLATEDEQRASVAIRTTLHHALETLFSILGAYIQAHDCPYAWLAKCSTSDLRIFVQRVSSGYPDIFTKINMPSVDWATIAEAIFHKCFPDTDKQRRTVACFSNLWVRFAQDFLNTNYIDEYNSLKHGFRVRRGGFSLAMGKQPAEGVPAPKNEMHLLGKSDFGTSFFKIEPIGSDKRNRGIRARRTSVNWSIERDILSLQLAYMSLNNVISALRIANGWPASECMFLRPENDEDFHKPWQDTPGVTSVNIDHVIDEENTFPVTKQELLARVRELLGNQGN